MNEGIKVNCEALESAAERLAADCKAIQNALEAIGAADGAQLKNIVKRRSAAKKAAAALSELERERLFLLECAKRFRGAQTRAVKRSEKL